MKISEAQEGVDAAKCVVANGRNCDSNSGNGTNTGDIAGGCKPAAPEASNAPVTSPQHFAIPEYKVLIVGDSGVGKSSLLSRFVNRSFNLEKKANVGFEFTSVELEVPAARVGEKERVIAQLWDTAGQERCAAIRPNFFRGAVGALLVYDVTQEETLLRLSMWCTHLRRYACEGCVCVVLGNKTDLQSSHFVSKGAANDIVNRLGMRHFTASALKGSGVREAFMQLVSSINAVQRARRLAAVKQQEKTTTTAAPQRSITDPALVSIPCGGIQSGTLFRKSLSSSAVFSATSAPISMSGEERDRREFVAVAFAVVGGIAAGGGGKTQTEERAVSPNTICCSWW
ncbi:guanin nucleotide-binding protein, putative [Trypanosoma cruzi marinkellei]|uniref:Guanin nucleotide-binding protein, putative n=1 Tax=Trypanosoma cruzi marinkellei TaxID=85056 RepID=K2N079_TRYCR|nr:guanin nucleotide-binding protein, putative [Trypanosoma cruzi marinkellei]